MRISIVLATFNGEAWLPRQLASLSAQSRLPDELIIYDDASTDQSPAVLRAFAATAPFPVRFESQSERVGAAVNFQSAIAAANADVIALCDQDDVWHPDKLQRLEAEFLADPSLDLVFSDADVVDQNLHPLGYSAWDSVGFTSTEQARARQRGLAALLVRFNVVSGAAMAFAAKRRSLLLPIPPGWVHDGWIALVLAAVGRCRWIKEPLLAYRQHPDQQIGAAPRSLRGQIDIARRMDGAYFDGLVGNFAACADRIAADPAVAPRTLELIKTKIEHCRARRDMRLRRAPKALLLMRELLSGRYTAASLGFKSILQDTLLA